MKKQSGFSAFAALAIVVIIGLVGFAGWLVWQKNKDTADTKQTTTNKTQPSENRQTFTLASKEVTFTVPNGWTKDGTGCVKDSPAYASAEYLDSVALLPGEKLPTIYGDGTEYFHVNVCVFDNTKGMSPEDWFNDVVAGGYPSDQDVSSTNSINGKAAYYIKFVRAEHGYDEIHYVLSAKGKIVEVKARTYETEAGKSGGDFAKFEDDIETLVESLNF